MTNQKTQGSINDGRGKLEEAVGKVSGDRREEAKGKVRQVQGHAQKGLGNVQDAARRDEGQPPTA